MVIDPSIDRSGTGGPPPVLPEVQDEVRVGEIPLQSDLILTISKKTGTVDSGGGIRLAVRGPSINLDPIACVIGDGGRGHDWRGICRDEETCSVT